MKIRFKVFQHDDSFPMLYQSYEEVLIGEHNFDGTDGDRQDSLSEDALLENYNSSHRL